MRILRLGRDIKDLARLREIVTILARNGFSDLVAKARLKRHAAMDAAPAPTTPERVRATLEELGPTFVKLGQLLSIRPDLIPEPYCEEFRRLQDEVPPLGWPVVKGVVESELAAPLGSRFRSFKQTPIAAASVAQVHEARLKDGTRVAVKVQRPGIGQTMRRDIDLMRFLAARFDRHVRGVDAVGIVQEFERYTERELDFRTEARTIKRFHAFFKDSVEVRVPAAHEAFTTQRLLVMDYLEGTRMSDKAALARGRHDRSALAAITFRALFDMSFTLGIFHADPHPGNLLAIRKAAKERVGLLDFGIVGYLDTELRHRALQFLDYLLKRDVRGLAWVLQRIGRPTRRLDRRGLERELGRLVTEWYGTTLGEQRVGEISYRVFRTCRRQGLDMPPDIVLLGKALVTIEGACAWLDPDFNPFDALKPALDGLTRGELVRQKESLLRAATDMGDFASKLPLAADAFLERLEEGKVQLSVDHDEVHELMEDFDLEMSRRNLALVSTGFFLGSAFLAGMARDLAFLGIPLWQLGFGLFLVTLAMLGIVTFKAHRYVARER